MEVVVLVIWTNDDALMRQLARVFPKACASMRICLRLVGSRAFVVTAGNQRNVVVAKSRALFVSALLCILF